MKLIRKLISVLLIMAMVIATVPATSYAVQKVEIKNNSMMFTDMPNDWSKAALENTVSNGLLSGCDGKIMPKENLTRAQMAVIINRAFGTTEKASLDKYKDVSAKSWYYADMQKAVQMKTFVGSDNKLNPESNITREEAFTVLARAFKLSGTSENALNKFIDKDLVSSWAKDATASIVTAGYVVGSNNKLNPKKNITRAEFAQIMDNILKNYIKKADTYTEDLEGNVMINVPNVTLKDMKINGDLIIGDGVGDGDITLDGVVITGRTVIRGGGVDSIKIIGNSKIKNIVIARVDGKLRVYTEDGLEIGDVIVDGNDDVIVEGDVGVVTVTASDVTVTATNAKIETATVEGDNSKIIVSAKSTVNEAEIKGEDAEIIVLEGSRIESVIVDGDGAEISGKGKVGEVEARGDDISVSTPGTKVEAAEGTEGVKAGEKTVDEGKTETVGGKKKSSKHHNSSSSTSPLMSYTPVTLTQTGNICDNSVQYRSAAAIIAELPTEIVVTLEDASLVNVPVTWVDTDIYDAQTAGTYTFTATWGDMPTGANNNNHLEEPTVEVIVLAGEEGEVATPENYFTFDKTTGTITGYNIEGGLDVVIPFAIDGVEVNIIGDRAFEDCSKLTSITIPDSVTSIEDYAFSFCSGLTSITIPDSVKSIGDDAFCMCNGLTSITLGNGVERIGKDAFSECTSLTSITIPNSVISMGWNTFYNCTGLTSLNIPDSVTSIGYGLISGCTSIKSVTIGNGVTSIDSRMFANLSELERVNIGNNVTSIGREAFKGCTKLMDVNIPDKVKSIEQGAFQGCTSLIEINIPDSVTSLGVFAFDGCNKLTSATIGSGVTTIFYGVFRDCTGLTSVTIGSGVVVNDNAFINTASNNNFKISYTIGGAGTYVYNGSDWIRQVDPLEITAFSFDHLSVNGTIDESNKAIRLIVPFGTDVTSLIATFTKAEKSTVTVNGVTQTSGTTANDFTNPIEYKITAEDGSEDTYTVTVLVETDGQYFDFDSETGTITGYDIAGGSDVVIPAIINGTTVTGIGDLAFEDCQLTSVFIQESVTTIGMAPFANCTKLTKTMVENSNENYSSLNGVLFNKDQTKLIQYSVGKVGSYAIPNGVTSIEIGAFYPSNGLDSVIIPDSVISIGESAFYGCSNLTNITFGSSVDSIGDNAFENTGFENVIIPDSVNSIGNDAFAECSKLTSITIGNSVNSIGEDAFSRCGELTSVIIKDDVENIPECIFFKCNKLASIIFGSSVNTFGSSVNNIDFSIFNECSDSITEFIVEDGNANYSSSDGVIFNKNQTTLLRYPCGKIGSYIIPDSVYHIEDKAFYECLNLTSVTFGSGFGSIGDYSFELCTNLAEFIVNDSNENYSSLDGMLFNKDQTILVLCPLGKTGNCIIPDSVESIADKAFGYCQKLTGVVFGENVTSVGEEAFHYCTKMTSVTFGSKLESIGDSAFKKCNLTSIILPDSVTSIGIQAFAYSSNLTSITIGSNVTIGENAFKISSNDNFETAYSSGGAGTYTYQNYGNWSKN